MKKKLPIILLGVILACVLVFGFLYANNDIGKTANSLEADIRQSQKILDDWIVDGSISDTMAAFISYPQDKTDHTFSVYVNRPGLSFGYFFRGGGDIVEVDDYIAEFVVEGNNEMILSRLVDTFFSRISLTMQLHPKPHSTAYVLPWEEVLHWQCRSSDCSSS